MKANIGLIGMAVMGQNLVLNMNDSGYSVAVFNRTNERTENFISGPAKGRETILPSYSIDSFVNSLEKPRKIILMVKAGDVVDMFINKLLPLLEAGDLIVDGGNSYYKDSQRRYKELKEKDLRFIGMGISGGEEGARNGPSMMPGGDPEAWPLVKEIFQAVAAKTEDGFPCCQWIGHGGAGHYVKMVHNGIEYGDMQLISESFHFLKTGLGYSYEEMSDIFKRWNATELDSYLIEITSEILKYKENDGTYLLEKILDAAKQKGTGKWTAENALNMGMPVTLIAEAVFARALSAMKTDRIEASAELAGPSFFKVPDRERMKEDVRRALLASKIVSYAQGFLLLAKASKEFGWELKLGEIALIWREGCIIRSAFLERIKQAIDEAPDAPTLLMSRYFSSLLREAQQSWRKVISNAVLKGVPFPAHCAALAFYDGIRCERLPANLIQAQRDFFGAHMYERVDSERGKFFHTNWTGEGGEQASTTYEG
ncbi:MAG: decarboxylating NADP(+)-dependent phosphogluconate dehydrogenase [Spirochaetia bacterium]